MFQYNPVEDVLCNLCGHTCVVGTPAGLMEQGGLIKACASGGYESTPGNGHGALDDTTSYKFSLCEFCLDWMFSQFVIPVEVSDYMNPNRGVEIWKPAAERVAKDDWRKMKERFTKEAARRAQARMRNAGK